MNFVYFVVDSQQGGLVAKHGLSYAFPGPGSIPAVPATGPEGHRGFYVCGSELGAEFLARGFDATAFSWEKISATAWAGYDSQHLPTPEDLMRHKVFDGPFVRLMDERKWIVPVARQLPRKIRFSPEGGITESPTEKYRDMFSLCDKIWHMFRTDQKILDDGEEPYRMDDEESARAALKILQLNYRIGPAEANILEIFDSESVLAVLMAFVDWTAFVEVNAARMEAVKKKSTARTRDGGRTASGVQAF